jgi:hypothetical protein
MDKGFDAERLREDTEQWVDLSECETDEELQAAIKAAIAAALEAVHQSRSFTAADDMQVRLGIFMAQHAEVILDMLDEQ